MKTHQSKQLINCDLGEGLDAVDAAVMPYLNQANIACGGHAGNETTMHKTLTLAKKHRVSCGAHPSYPDRINFGRVSQAITPEALGSSIKEQVQQLLHIANQHNILIDYIKPHGALYNDSCKPHILNTLISVASFFKLPLMLSASLDLDAPLNNSAITRHENTPHQRNPLKHRSIAAQCHNTGIGFIAEAFADRGYDQYGRLLKRGTPGALLNTQQSIEQVNNLVSKQGLYTSCGRWLNIHCQSLCVHSDTPSAIGTIKTLAQRFAK